MLGEVARGYGCRMRNGPRFRLVCEGVSKEEFTNFMKACESFGCMIALRNPFPGAFTPKDVHEIIAHVTGSRLAGMRQRKPSMLPKSCSSPT